MERTITVRGVGNISAKPDFIVIEMDIRGQSKNYSEALADASSAVEAVCNAAVSAGHSKDALKTINFGVSSEYDSVRNSKGTYQRVFVGYNCSYNTRLSFDFDRDMLERTLNAIAESKAEPELSIRFTVRDGSAVKSALLEAAAENARRAKRRFDLPSDLTKATVFRSAASRRFPRRPKILLRIFLTRISIPSRTAP